MPRQFLSAVPARPRAREISCLLLILALVSVPLSSRADLFYKVEKSVLLSAAASAPDQSVPMVVTGLNASGMMTGFFTDHYRTTGHLPQPVLHAFAWNNATQQYSDLHAAIGANSSMATCLNAGGSVAGVAWTNLGQQVAFVWHNGTATTFLSPTGDNIDLVVAINAAGHVIGTYYPGPGANKHAFFWDGTTCADLGDFGDSTHPYIWPQALNDFDQVVGTSYNATVTPPVPTAFVWQDEVFGYLDGADDFANTKALGLNNAGGIIGTYRNPTLRHDQYVSGGFYLADGAATDLGDLGGGGTLPFSLTAAGQVYGTSYGTGGALRLFGWNAGSILDLGAANLGATDLDYQMTSVNASGSIAGFVHDASNHIQAALGTGGAQVRLTALLPAYLAYTQMSSAYGSQVLINDAGMIACAGTDAAGQQMALLLSVDPDTNNDGLPDSWELQYYHYLEVDKDAPAAGGGGLTNWQAYQQGTDPKDFSNGKPATLNIVSGDHQSAPKSAFLTAPLVVKVINNLNIPATNVSATFTVTSGGAQLQAKSNSPPASQLTVQTDSSGQAHLYCLLPSVAVDHIYISVTSGNAPVVSFDETSTDGTTPPPGSTSPPSPSPFAPTNVVGYLNDDGSEDLSWTNNGDNPESIQISQGDGNGGWSSLTTVDPGTSSYHFDPTSHGNKGVGSPPVAATYPLPVQNYAAIDLNDALSIPEGATILKTALDDDNKVAVAYRTSDDPDHMTIVTWANGAVGSTHTYKTYEENNPDDPDADNPDVVDYNETWSITHLKTSGAWSGIHWKKRTWLYYYPVYGAEFTDYRKGCTVSDPASSTTPADEGMLGHYSGYLFDHDPVPDEESREGEQGEHIPDYRANPINGGAGDFVFGTQAASDDFGTDDPEGWYPVFWYSDENGDIHGISAKNFSFIKGVTGEPVFFDQGEFEISMASTAGHAVGYKNTYDEYGSWTGRDYLFSDGGDPQSVPFTDDPVALNDHDWVLAGHSSFPNTQDSQGNDDSGEIWHNGDDAPTNFDDLLADGPWKHKLTRNGAVALGNQNEDTGDFYAVTYSHYDDGTNGGIDKPVLWKLNHAANSSRRRTSLVGDSSDDELSAVPRLVRDPEGTIINYANNVKTNAEAAFLAFSDTTSGQHHVTLHLPISITTIADSTNADNCAPSPKSVLRYHNDPPNNADAFRIFVAASAQTGKATFKISTFSLSNTPSGKILIGLKLNGRILDESAPINSDGTCTLTVTPSATAFDEANVYTFVIGVDTNGDGKLSSTEVVETKYTACIITSSDLTFQLLFLKAGAFRESATLPAASQFLYYFCNSSNTILGQSSSGTAVYSSGNARIYLVAGSVYNSGQTQIPVFNFPDGSTISNEIKSTAGGSGFEKGLSKLIYDMWQAKKRDVVSFFSANPTITSHAFPSSVIMNGPNFDFGINADLAKAIGHANAIGGSIAFTVVRDNANPHALYPSQIELHTTINDVYDFDFTRGIATVSRHAAMVQIGYSLPGRVAGRIFENNTAVNVTYGQGSDAVLELQSFAPFNTDDH